MSSGPRLFPLFLVALFLGAVAALLGNLVGWRTYPPRLLLLGSIVFLIIFFYCGRRELLFLLVRVRHVAEPGPATTWLLAAGVLLVGSLVLEQAPVRLDATGRRLNSLSEASRTVLAAGDRPLEFIGVYRETNPQRDRAEGLMDVYRTATRRVSVEMLDPDRRPDRARDLGLRRSGLILVRSGDITEEVSDLTERSLSQAIVRAENPRRVRIAFTVGHGERRIADGGPGGLSKLGTALRDTGYEPTEIGLLDEEIPNDAAAVAVIGPRRRLLPIEIEKLGNHLDTGGRMLLCLEPGTDVGLDKMLRARGILLDSLEVVDDGPATRGLGFGPRVLVVADYRSHPVVAPGIGYTIFPGARPVRLREKALWGITAGPLFVTGPDAYLAPARAEGDPPSPGKRGRHPLAAFQEWEVPGTGTALPGEVAPEKPYGRLIVVGDSDWLTGSFLDLFGNGELASRSFHWLSRREFLLRIAPLDRRGSPLRLSQTGIGTLLIVHGFLVLSLFGVGVWVWNRRR